MIRSRMLARKFQFYSQTRLMIVGVASTSLLATVQERTSPALEDPTCALKRSVEIEPKNIHVN